MTSELTITKTASCPQEICSAQSTIYSWNYSLLDIGVNISSSHNVSHGNTSVLVDVDENLLSQEAQNSLIILYGFTILFSIAGNILVVIVFTKGRRCRTDIRPFLINLAVADLIMALFCMPFTFTYVMTRTWIFSKPMCPIVLFIQHLSVCASVFTNMAIGIDRFLVVTFPLRARMTTKRARYTICTIWICSVGLSSVQLVVGRAKTYGEIVHCDEQWTSHEARRTFTLFVLFITYIIPLVILSVTYSIVSIIMWKRTAPGNAHENRDMQQLRGKRKVIKMLVIVVVMFGLCWLPLQTFFLVLDFNPQLLVNASRADHQLFTVIYYTVFWLAMSNSCANPFIYGFTNESFRSDLATLCYLRFPYCWCLKQIADRKLSVSTFESTYTKRVGTVRKSPGTSIAHQSGYINGSRVYIELKKNVMSRTRSQPNMSQFYKEKKLTSCLNGRPLHHCYQLSCNHYYHRQQHHRPFFRTRSGDYTQPFNPYIPIDYDDRVSPISSANDSDRKKASASPTTTITADFLFTRADNNNSSCTLNPLQEADICDNTAFSKL